MSAEVRGTVDLTVPAGEYRQAVLLLWDQRILVRPPSVVVPRALSELEAELGQDRRPADPGVPVGSGRVPVRVPWSAGDQRHAVGAVRALRVAGFDVRVPDEVDLCSVPALAPWTHAVLWCPECGSQRVPVGSVRVEHRVGYRSLLSGPCGRCGSRVTAAVSPWEAQGALDGGAALTDRAIGAVAA